MVDTQDSYDYFKNFKKKANPVLEAFRKQGYQIGRLTEYFCSDGMRFTAEMFGEMNWIFRRKKIAGFWVNVDFLKDGSIRVYIKVYSAATYSYAQKLGEALEADDNLKAAVTLRKMYYEETTT